MKKDSFIKLKLKQIDKSLEDGKLVPMEQLGQRIKDIRETLGMTQKQLAKRLKVKQPVISRIEENILSSSLITVTRIVNALGCEFFGAVASKRSLKKVIREQAEITAKKMLNRTYANMAMENQSPPKESYNYQLKRLINELAANPGSALWEE